MSESKEQSSNIGMGEVHIPARFTWRDKWNAASTKTRKLLGWVAGLLAAIAVSIGNLESVERYVISHLPSSSIPEISVNLFNSGKESVGIIARGEFLMFFPSTDANYVVGKYELEADNSDPILKTNIITGVVIVPTNEGTLLRLRIMNIDYFEKILRRGDSDISFMFRYQNGEHVPSENVRNDTRPFTIDSLKTRLLVDVAVKTPNPAVERDAPKAARPSP